MTGKGKSGPAFHVAASDASGPPAVAGAHPADTSAERAIRAMVEAGRARRVSWGNLAKMTGKSEAYLRRLGID